MGSTDRDDVSAVHQSGPERRRGRSRPEVDHRFDAAAEAANQDLRALQALTDTALSHLSLDDLLPALLERITDILTVDNAAVLLLDEAGQTLRVKATRGLEEPVATQVRVPLGQGFAGRIAATREPLAVDEVATFPVVNPLLREKLHSLAGVPLVIGNQVLGVLHVGTALPRHFTVRDVQLLQQVADRMALAIDRARLYTREQQAREQAEAALAQAQASEHRFQQLVEANIVGVVVSDTERIFEANDEYLRVVGYAREDLEAGRLRYDRVKSPDTYPLAERVIEELLTTGVSTAIEREYIRKDGSRIAVLVAGILLQRDPPRFASFVFDLSERKRMEQMLAERVAQLEAVMEAVPYALAVYDTAGRVILANAVYQAHVPPGETLAERIQHIGGVFDEHGVPIEEAQWPQTRALQGEILAGTNAVELAVHSPVGELAYTRLTAAPLRDQAGNIIGVVTLNQNITQQKRLERERAEQAEQLDRIFEHIADGLLVHNAQGQPVRLNAAARRILGLDAAPSEYSQLPASDRAVLYEAHDDQGRLLTPEGWPLMSMLSGQVTQVHTREMRLRILDGREVDVTYSLAPLRDQHAHVVGAVTILHDQTEQKRLAREREEARAHELALEDIARHMDEFLATASHDLRTPLTVVKSRLQIALRRLTRLQDSGGGFPDTLPETDLQALYTSLLAANQSADKLTHLVALLFDVARARSGTLELELAPVDLAALVREQVAAQQAAAPRRTIELVVPDSPVVWVQADADRLSQVLGNYLTNALKYSTKDQPVTVRLDTVEDQAVVSVADHGPGIPVEEQSRIWELFHRVPGIELQYESGESSGSLGLGLHICKQLVELHPGGSVGVESAVGKGSTFWFRLPLVS
jgi:PAS domain S-box-containing protein